MKVLKTLHVIAGEGEGKSYDMFTMEMTSQEAYIAIAALQQYFSVAQSVVSNADLWKAAVEDYDEMENPQEDVMRAVGANGLNTVIDIAVQARALLRSLKEETGLELEVAE